MFSIVSLFPVLLAGFSSASGMIGRRFFFFARFFFFVNFNNIFWLCPSVLFLDKGVLEASTDFLRSLSLVR